MSKEKRGRAKSSEKADDGAIVQQSVAQLELQGAAKAVIIQGALEHGE